MVDGTVERRPVRLGLAQCNPQVGDVDGNVAKVADAYRRAVRAGAEVVCATELVVTGYPPEDLVLKPAFVEANSAALRRLAGQVGTAPSLWASSSSCRARAAAPGIRPTG